MAVLLSQLTSAGAFETPTPLSFRSRIFIYSEHSQDRERLRTATGLTATANKLHRDDYIGCYALAGISDRFGLEVLISVVTLYEFARYSRYKTDNDFPAL